MASYRFKDPQGIDAGCNTANWSDQPPTTWASLADQPNNFTSPISVTRFDPYTNAEYFRSGALGIQVTCGSAHGLTTGQFVSLYFPGSGNPPFHFNAAFSDGSHANPSWWCQQVYVTGTTTFVFANNFGVPISAQTLPSGALLWKISNSVPLATQVKFANDHSLNPMFSFPMCATSASITAAVAYVAANLDAGLSPRFEVGNEPWNGGNVTGQYLARLAPEFALTNSSTPWQTSNTALLLDRYYMLRYGQMTVTAQAAWTAGGRSEPCRGVVNMQFSNATQSLTFWTNCAALYDINGNDAPGYTPLPYQDIAIAPYWSGNPVLNASLTTGQYNTLTVPQVADINDACALNMRATSYGMTIQGHAANIAALNSTYGLSGVALITYEGGFDNPALGGTDPTQSQRRVAAVLHPRARVWMTQLFNVCDENNVKLFTFNACEGQIVTQGDPAYLGFTMLPGDGTANLSAIQGTGGIAQNVNLTGLVSPVGLAVQNWNPAVLAMPSVPTSLTATAVSSSEIDSSWTPGSGGGAVAHYSVESSPDGTTWAVVGTPTAASFANTGLTASTLTYFRVAAVNASGTSAYTSSVSATTQAPGSYTPQVLPTFLAGAVVKAASNTTQWQAYKGQTDAALAIPIGYYNDNGGEVVGFASMYPCVHLALSYRCLLSLNQSLAYDYADRAIGQMLTVARAYTGAQGIDKRHYYCKFIAFGDGVTTTFTVPDADFIPNTLCAWIAPITTTATTRGTSTTASYLDDINAAVGSGGNGKLDNTYFINCTDSSSDTYLTATKYAMGVDFRFWPYEWYCSFVCTSTYTSYYRRIF